MLYKVADFIESAPYALLAKFNTQTWLLICEHRLYKSAMRKANLARNTIVFKIYKDRDCRLMIGGKHSSNFKRCIVETPIAEFYLEDIAPYKYDFPYLNHDLVLDFISNKDGVEMHERAMLHPIISKRILRYLCGIHLPKKYVHFDCIDFVNELFFGPNIVPRGVVNLDLFQLNLNKSSGVNDDSNEYVNDGLLLTDETVKIPIHLAIFIGHNLFLSKYGTSEHLLISNIEEMLKTYDKAKKIIKVTPKSEMLTAYYNKLQLTSLPNLGATKFLQFRNDAYKDNNKEKRALVLKELVHYQKAIQSGSYFDQRQLMEKCAKAAERRHKNQMSGCCVLI